MQTIDHTDNDSSNRDPIDLPDELFSSILSLLPPPSIAQSSGISRLWRDSINSNPTLHQELDLSSRAAGHLDLPVISGHFHRLASLSQNRLVKVSMDFSAFCSEWLQNEDATFFGDFLARIKMSKDTLQELRFLIDEPSDPDRESTMDFILSLLESLTEMRSLRSIWIEFPLLHVSLKCGDQTPGSPQLVIQGAGIDEPDIDEVIPFIVKVKNLIGKSLTEFSFHHWGGWQTAPDHLVVKLFEELSKSKLEMNQLDVFDLACPQIAWPFIIQFESLTDLQLLMFGPQALGENEVLRVPQDVIKGVPMKHLRLEWHGLEVDWESVARWFGSSLENLKLGIDVAMSRDSGFLLSNSYGSIVYNSQETLKVLHLFTPETGSPVFHVDPAETSDTTLSFPNLEELSLRNVNDSIFQIFSSLDSPKLHKLEIESAYPFFQDSNICLISNLERHASRITELTILMAMFHTFPLKRKSLNFKCLQRLEIKVGPKALYDWLSVCQFQNLESLSCEEERLDYPCLQPYCSCGEEKARNRSEDFKLLMQLNAPKLRLLNDRRIRNA